MLIDFSDVLQIDVYELGRTYLRFVVGKIRTWVPTYFLSFTVLGRGVKLEKVRV